MTTADDRDGHVMPGHRQNGILGTQNSGEVRLKTGVSHDSYRLAAGAGLRQPVHPARAASLGHWRARTAGDHEISQRGPGAADGSMGSQVSTLTIVDHAVLVSSGPRQADAGPGGRPGQGRELGNGPA